MYQSHRLAAIMFADIIGYTGLMGLMWPLESIADPECIDISDAILKNIRSQSKG